MSIYTVIRHTLKDSELYYINLLIYHESLPSTFAFYCVQDAPWLVYLTSLGFRYFLTPQVNTMQIRVQNIKGLKYRALSNQQLWDRDSTWKKTPLTVNDRLEASHNPALPKNPSFLYSFTQGDFQFLLSLKTSWETNTWKNHRKKEMQQPPQKPCQKALTIKVSSWLIILFLQCTRSQTHFLSHSWHVMFQLAIFSRTCTVDSTTIGLQVCTSLKSVLPSACSWQEMPEAWMAPMLSFQAKQYLNRSRVTLAKEQAMMNQNPRVGNSGPCMQDRGNASMCTAQKMTSTAAQPTSCATIFQGEGIRAYWLLRAMQCSKSIQGKAVLIGELGRN